MKFLFDNGRDVLELEERYRMLSDAYDELSERFTYSEQNVGTARFELETMRKYRDDEYLDKLVTSLTKNIEDCFVGGFQSRDARFKHIHMLVKQTIVKGLQGHGDWLPKQIDIES